MANLLYRGTRAGDSTLYYFLATDDDAATTFFASAFPDSVEDSCNEVNGDISLFDPITYLYSFRIKSRTGKIYIASGNSLALATARIHALGTGEKRKLGRQLTGNFSLVSGLPTSTPTNPTPGLRPFGGSAHLLQGTSHPDYTLASLPLLLQMLQTLGWTHLRLDVSMSGSGVPTSTNFATVMAWMATNSIGAWGLGTTHDYVTASSNAMPGPDVGGSTYSTSLLDSLYTGGYNKIHPFMVANAGKFTHWEIGNENDNKCIKSGQTGTAWNSTNYNLEYQKAYFAEMLGMYWGIRDADPNVQIGFNYCTRHYAWPIQMMTDFVTCPSYLTIHTTHPSAQINWIANHWYNDSEYDNNHSTPVVQNAGQCMSIMSSKLKQFGVKMGITEIGLYQKPNWASNPSHFTTGGMWLDFKRKYWDTVPKADFLFWYESFKEPLARAQSTVIEQQMGIQSSTASTLNSDVILVSQSQP